MRPLFIVSLTFATLWNASPSNALVDGASAYLACTTGACFAYDKEPSVVKTAIESRRHLK